MTSQNLTNISEIGEFNLINRLTKNVNIQHSETLKGIGDDAAVVNYGNKNQVITTDLLVEGIHFNLSYTPLKHLGYKAVAVNLSDVYAMNAIPLHITVSIAVSSRFTVEALDELYDGIKAACKKYKVDLIGGDTTSSIKGLVISITAIGIVPESGYVLRSGAKENNLICLSGNVGAAYMGLQLLEREKAIFEQNPEAQPQLHGYDYILQRQLKPEPRADLIEFLYSNNIVPTAMIDVSDGLSSEILHICQNSNTGCEIYEDRIPIAEETASMAYELNMEPLLAALNGGEDYELLFTINIADYEKIKDSKLFSIIGNITSAEKGTYIVDKNDNVIPLNSTGYQAFNN